MTTLSQLGFAQQTSEDPQYEIHLSRVHGDTTCLVDLQDSKNFECKITFAGRATETIQMNKEPKKGKTAGYSGKLESILGNTTHFLIADANRFKKLRSVTFASQKKGSIEQTINLQAVSTATDKIHLSLVNPIKVQPLEENKIKVTAKFLVYQSLDDQQSKGTSVTEIPDMLMSKIQLVISSLRL